jgi:hypothetical protein
MVTDPFAVLLMLSSRSDQAEFAALRSCAAESAAGTLLQGKIRAQVPSVQPSLLQQSPGLANSARR